MITQESILEVFKKSLRTLKGDPYMEKLRVSYKLDDVEIYSKEFNKEDYEKNSIKADSIYSDIEQLRRKHGVHI